MNILTWALWGLAGAFIYAGPKVIVCLSNPTLTARIAAISAAEFVFALTIGPIFAAGIGPWLALFLHLSAKEEYCAVALVAGMLSNPIGPLMINALSSGIIKRIADFFGAAK